MEQTITREATLLSAQSLLEQWQGHRSLTRKVIEAFPEKEFFEFSIGGMRTAEKISKELLAIAAPAIREFTGGQTEALDEELDSLTSREQILGRWDQDTEEINRLFPLLKEADFAGEILLFGKFPGTRISSLLYIIDNEIHHRGQLYVYLRALGIEPPAFWDR